MSEQDSCNIYGGFTIYAKWGEIQGELNEQTDLKDALDSKVDKIEGKSLSTNDYTDEEKNKVSSSVEKIKTLENQISTKVEKVSGKSLSTNDYTDEEKNKVSSSVEKIKTLENQISTKVEKVSGKGLSTNDYTNADKSKVNSAIQGIKGNGTLINPDSNKIVNVTPSNIGAVPTSRMVNGKSLSENIILFTYGTWNPSGGANGDLYFKYS